jgi:integrase
VRRLVIAAGTARTRTGTFGASPTPEQFQQICEKLDEPFRTMVVIAMCLGLRVSEILALKWANFDFEDGTLMITRGTVHARIGR